MRVRITETGFGELQQIKDSIALHNPTAARAVVFRIEQVIHRIGMFPEIAHPVAHSDIRIFPARPFPFLIFYIIRNTEVIIRNIRYSGRRFPESQ